MDCRRGSGSGQSGGADLGGWGQERGAEKLTPADKAADAHRAADCIDCVQSARGVAHACVGELHRRVTAVLGGPTLSLRVPSTGVAPRSEAAQGTHGVHIPHAQVEEVLRGLQARVGSGQSAGTDLGG